MTHSISVPTPFTDIAELAESFAQRADEERLMLWSGEPAPEGEWVQFTVTFDDGSAALAGIGRCASVFDNGEDRAPEQRFDIVLDSLELDEMGQVYFERILMVRAQQMGGEEPATGEVMVADEAVSDVDASFVEAPVEVDAYAAEPAADAFAYAEPPAEEPVAATYEGEAYDAGAYDAQPAASYDPAPSDYDAPAFEEPAPSYAEPEQPSSFEDLPLDSVSGEVSTESVPAPSRARARSVERLAPPVASIYALPPPAAPGQLPSPHANGQALTRRLVAATWTPTPMLRPDPSPSSGHFQYGDSGLPRPASPPRPANEASLRVARAPRPGDPLAASVMRSSAVPAGAAAVAYDEQAYAGEAYAEDAGAEGYEDAEAYEAQYAGEGETRQVDIGAIGDDDYGEEPVAVDVPEDEDQY